MSLSGTKQAKEPLRLNCAPIVRHNLTNWSGLVNINCLTFWVQFSHKGFKTATFYRVCSFLYILDMTTFTRYPNGRRMYKKCTFYTYVCTVKYNLYGNNVLLYFCTCILIVKSHLSCKYWVAFYFANKND